MRAIFYLLFVAAALGVGYLISMLFPSHNLTYTAQEAEMLIGNTRLYAKEHAYERSLHHLSLAMEKITEIEQDLDESSQKVIDKALLELDQVKAEIEGHEIVDKDMNHAFAKALNALTFAELKVSEHFIETDDYHDAIVALKYGMVHIQNALRFVESDKADYELHIYAEIDSLIHHTDMPKEEIVAELEKMLAELDTLVEEF